MTRETQECFSENERKEKKNYNSKREDNKEKDQREDERIVETAVNRF